MAAVPEAKIERRLLRHTLGQTQKKVVQRLLKVAVFSGLIGIAVAAYAANQILWDTVIETVSVNGGAGTANPGTTCIRVSPSLAPSCPSGYIAIPNNNKELIVAALTAKATGSRVMVYYDDSPNAGMFHCPVYAFTPCNLVNIELK